MNRIKELPKSSSQLLSSTQIISSVHSVVKELIENSLDSFATNIEIKLEDFGLEKIEVKDNGKGIHKDDINFVAKPHCTSKITSHLDLNEIETYGFRGEALAALCSVSELVMTTKTTEENFGFTYTFDHNGNVLTTKPCPCNQGTAVISTNLFKNIPVRKQFYRSDKNKKDELKKVEDILVAFGCIQTGVRFTLFHNRNLIWQKPSVHKPLEGLVQIFGNAVMDHMENCEFKDNDTQIKIEVFLPKINAPLSCSQSSLNRSIVAINKRPVRMKIIDKLLKEYFNKSSDFGTKSRYPICYIAIEMPSSTIDVNFEPNKTAVAMENNNLIVDQLTKILSSFYNTNNDPLTEAPKNIQAHSLEEPQIQGLKSSKIPSELNSKTIAPTFQMKLSQIAPDFKKPATSSKLSRGKDPVAPSSKRRKTSASFSTPPNDIHRHIDTLKSFFQPEKNEGSGGSSGSSNPGIVSETVPVIPPDAQRTLCNGMFGDEQSSAAAEKGAQSNGTSFLNDQCNAVAVQRPPINVTSALNELCSPVTIQRTPSNETLKLNGHCNSESSAQNAHSNEMSLLSNPCTVVTAQRERDGEISVKKTHFGLNKSHELKSNEKEIIAADKMIIDQEVHSRKKSDSFKDIVKNLEVNSSSKESSPSNINEWSRGLHSVEKSVQPVAVLKPKVVGKPKMVAKHQDHAETVINIESLEDKKEFNEISPNRRKVTPFDFFCRKHRLEVASLNPDFNNHQIAQILTEKWSNLSIEEKAAYKNMVSEDCPKTMQNKENIRKVVTESLNKTKEKSRIYKKVVRKMKPKCKESSVQFNMELIKLHSSPNYSSDKEIDNELNVMSCLTPGIWICSQQHKLYVLNCFRLQETIVFHRLLETYQFEPEPLDSPFILTSHSLGDDAMNVLSQMNVTVGYGNECIISDENLIANGFKIRLIKGELEDHFEVIGMAQNIAFYGVPDLKEILLVVKEKGFSVNLEKCRPGKVILYLQGEAVRIARQYPASKNLEDIEELLSKRKVLSSTVCIHSKPILQEIFTIPTE